jgi:PAS domain S-box-containing protein
VNAHDTLERDDVASAHEAVRALQQALRDSEARHAFLLSLSDVLRPLSDVGAIKSAACRLLGEHLGVSRVTYADIDGDELVADHNYHTADVAPLVGRYPLRSFGECLLGAYRGGEPVVVSDVRASALFSEEERRNLIASGITAFVGCMLLKSGRSVGAFGVHHNVPRTWRPQEVDLICDVGDRICAAAQRALAEAALRESEARFRLAAKAAGFGLYSHDVRRNQSWWSDELYALMGLPPGTPITLEIAQTVTHPQDRERMLRRTLAALDPAGSGELAEEFRILRADSGEERWMYTRAQTLFEIVSGERLATTHTGVMFDVTDRKLAEEALRRADRQKNDFLAMLSHELRNPLAAIRNAGEILSRLVGAAPEVRAPLAMLGRQTGQLTRLVEDLLDIARIAQGLILLREEPLEIAEVIDQAVETVQPLVREKSHCMTVAKPIVPIHIRGDRARLVQCVANLLHNAVKYTEPGGEIEVRVQERGPEVSIEVRDNGGGIAPELLPHVFDLFVQSERALDRTQGGLGIGLSVVQHLVQRHGGSVSAASPGVGLGSTFTILLPRLEPPPRSAIAPSAEKAPPRRILVIDDDPDAADSIAMLLQLDGHEVDVAYAALAGLEAASRLRPEVILLDIGLPRMSGYEVARRLRENEALRATRLVALSGFGRIEDRERARAAGFDDHLVKPASLEALAQVLAMPSRSLEGEARKG